MFWLALQVWKILMNEKPFSISLPRMFICEHVQADVSVGECVFNLLPLVSTGLTLSLQLGPWSNAPLSARSSLTTLCKTRLLLVLCHCHFSYAFFMYLYIIYHHSVHTYMLAVRPSN